MPPISPTGIYQVSQCKADEMQSGTDTLAEEVPIALVYNGISHVVMLATPQDLEDFALGFSLTEGIIQQPRELYGVEVVEQKEGVELHCEISAARFAGLKEIRRNLLGRTGCGLCGAESLAQAMRAQMASHKLPALQAVTHDAIQRAYVGIAAQQPLNQLTGATHASAWVNADGKVMLAREDVGRHNALDKLIGALAKCAQVEQGFVLTTSRASYEMIQKVASVGVALLAAVSAPTGLAVRFAKDYDVTLVGFVRDARHVVYAHEERLVK